MQDAETHDTTGHNGGELRVAEFGAGESGILDTLHDYTSDQDMQAYDIVLFDTRRFIPRLELLATGDDNLWSGVERFFGRLHAFLRAGGTLVVVPAAWEQFSQLNGYLPNAIEGLQALMGCEPIAAEGDRAASMDDARFAAFVAATDGAIAYTASLRDVTGTSVIAGTDADTCIGAYREPEDGGLVVLLPAFRPDQRDRWFDAVTTLVRTLRDNADDEGSVPSTLPDWTSRYQFLNEIDALERIDQRKQQLEDLVRELERDRDYLAQVRARKALFANAGEALQTHVDDALQAIGFQLSPLSGGGRDDVVARCEATPGDVAIRVVASSSQLVDDADVLRQIFRQLSDHAGTTGDVAKAIVVANTWQGDELSARDGKDGDFPPRLVEVASQQQWCLMTGLQLLCMSLDAEANPDRRGQLAAQVMSTGGILDAYRDWRSYIDERAH